MTLVMREKGAEAKYRPGSAMMRMPKDSGKNSSRAPPTTSAIFAKVIEPPSEPGDWPMSKRRFAWQTASRKAEGSLQPLPTWNLKSSAEQGR
ncbi:hypothetical protein QR680_005134 [Steinernema hermaphroditum]|uniref:Uncharacterized protein n=1 Tax=Steinernema hermaphroditum TaxID=289476 RepID=A0AA39LUB4_9BILA|nr:hypothetical protein QR680_005134 [Steinernema hermaphroditum]